MTAFIKSQAIDELGIPVVCFVMSGLTNKECDPDFEQLKQGVLNQDFEGDSILQGFWDLHIAVDRAGKKNMASPENLLRLIADRGSFPSINLLVDIYNYISVKSRVALGAHDCASVEGDVTLRLTDGSETFWPIGYSKPKGVSAGEYAYIDDGNEVICRMEVRQCEKSKVSLETTESFYIVQGNAETSIDFVRQTAQNLIELTQKYCGGELVGMYEG